MLFNSLPFLLFFTLFFPVYWLLNRNLRLRNFWILAGSYYFYGSWDWRFLFLIVISTVVDYWCGLAIHHAREQSTRKLFLAVSAVVNLGILFTFKYFGFFTQSLLDALAVFGIHPGYTTVYLVVPVGISFYTFQTLSYTFDIYNKKFEPTRDFVNFAAFVAFFPQLVAGPIERASVLLPQIERRASLNLERVRDGAWLVLWGLVKKVIIADRLSAYVDTVYNAPELFSPATCFTATFFFAMQIYCDFSGYSDIARGVARFLGIELMVNFDTPYFSTSLREFWQRWHISLSTWFRDYLYIPLGGSRGSRRATKSNLFITFVVSGLWHGAAYTYLLWGVVHALGYIFAPFTRWKHSSASAGGRTLQALAGWFSTMTFVFIAWIFFRADSLDKAVVIVKTLFSPSEWLAPVSGQFWTTAGMTQTELALSLLMIFVLLATDWFARGKGVDRLFAHLPKPVGWGYSLVLLAFFLMAAPPDTGAFIYFQF